MIPNRATPEGRQLGAMLARFADRELAGRRDDRCGTCAFRAGDHIANGSPATLMDALKCALEGDPFWCHEHDRPCAGWRALRAAKGQGARAPWDFVGGADLPDVICLPDQSGEGAAMIAPRQIVGRPDAPPTAPGARLSRRATGMAVPPRGRWKPGTGLPP